MREEPKAAAVAKAWKGTSPDGSGSEGRPRDGSVQHDATLRAAGVMSTLTRDLYTNGGGQG